MPEMTNVHFKINVISRNEANSVVGAILQNIPPRQKESKKKLIQMANQNETSHCPKEKKSGKGKTKMQMLGGTILRANLNELSNQNNHKKKPSEKLTDLMLVVLVQMKGTWCYPLGSDAPDYDSEG
ncbi:hypothetical protein Tco_0601199 [Tanacetum coccineum]